MKFSSTRATLISLFFGMGAFFAANDYQRLNVRWIVVTSLPLVLFFILRWPHEKPGVDHRLRAGVFILLGALATFTWTTFILMPEFIGRNIPQMLSDQVKSDFSIVGRPSSSLTSSWELDARQVRSSEGGPVWIASLVDKKIKAAPLEQTVGRILNPLLDTIENGAFVLLLLSILVVGLGLYISGYLENKKFKPEAP